MRALSAISESTSQVSEGGSGMPAVSVLEGQTDRGLNWTCMNYTFNLSPTMTSALTTLSGKMPHADSSDNCHCMPSTDTFMLWQHDRLFARR